MTHGSSFLDLTAITDHDFGTQTECVPLLSILCITFNHEKYIAEAINSFLMQKTNFPIEIVIGEDCSKDSTLDIARKYQERYPEIIHLITSNSNVGIVENFRRTLSACKGRYIAICEGDDYWTDNQKLQKQVAFLENNPEYVMTFHDAYSFDEHGFAEEPQLPKKFQCDASAHELLNARQISTLTVCFRNVLPEIPIEFDQVTVLDLCLWSLLGNFGKGKFLTDIKPAAYRLHQGGAISSRSLSDKVRMTMHTYLSLAGYYSRIGNEKLSQEFTLKAMLLGNSQLHFGRKIQLIIIEVDVLLGNPIYLVKQILTKLLSPFH